MNSRSAANENPVIIRMSPMEAISIGRINTPIPITKRRLNMLLPSIFPIDMPLWFFYIATADVANSGSDVPTATIETPMIYDGTPNISAMAVELFTTS